MVVSTVAIAKHLASFREDPIDNDSVTKHGATINQILEHLLTSPHWFCSLADPLVREAASFLLRLLAYENARVETWKQGLKNCLQRCHGCIAGLQEAKWKSRETYFAAFTSTVLNAFFQSFNEHELKIVISALTSDGILLTPDSMLATPAKTLADASSSTIYHIFANFHIFRDARIQTLIRSTSLLDFSEWPTDPLPAAMLVLLVDQDQRIREWATSFALQCKIVPIPANQFVGSYIAAVKEIPAKLTTPEAWTGFHSSLRHIPPESLVATKTQPIDLRRLIISHLHDSDLNFKPVLQCFILTLKRLGSNIWQGEGDEYPATTFDTFRENAAFPDLLISESGNSSKLYLAWLPEFLATIRDTPVFDRIFPKLVDFLCEELQQERFHKSRPQIMSSAIRIMASVFRLSPGQKGQKTMETILETHTAKIIQVAFASSHSHSDWAGARTAARDLVTNMLVRDTTQVSNAIDDLRNFLCMLQVGKNGKLIRRMSEIQKSGSSIRVPTVKNDLWSSVYDSIKPGDLDGMAVILQATAAHAHLDPLVEKAFAIAVLSSSSDECYQIAKRAFTQVNDGLAIMRSGFQDVVSRCANYDTSTSLFDLLSRPGMVQCIIPLLMSPNEDVQTAAQTIVGSAFDVDVRIDCFQALLENFPEEGMEALLVHLQLFNRFATDMPETCNLAKSLVRCLTDVIEAMCRVPNGLLSNPRFLRSAYPKGPATQLPKFWHLMANCSERIFKRTIAWSSFYDSQTMVEWMRDVVIFVKDMLSQRAVFEAAALTTSPQLAVNSQQLSTIGQQMLVDFQLALSEMTKWLRLTDEELLYQIVTLLQTALAIYETEKIRPLKETLDRLGRYTKDPATTRLSAAAITTLRDILSSFDSDDDDSDVVEIYEAPPERTATSSKTRLTTDAVVKSKRAKHPEAPILPSGSKSVPSGSNIQTLPTVKPRAVLKGFKNEGRTQKFKSPAPSPALAGDASDDSNDDEEDSGMEALLKIQKPTKAKPPKTAAAPRRQMIYLDTDQTNAIKLQKKLDAEREKIQRAKRRRNPDLSELHSTILSWKFEDSGDVPPSLSKIPVFLSPPNRFKDHNEYLRVFQPLLLLECWAQFIQAKENISPESYEVKMMERRHLGDSMLEVRMLFSGNIQRNWYLADTDIILLTNGQSRVIGKVVGFKNPRGMAATQNIEVTLQLAKLDGPADLALGLNTTWNIHKLFSLSTLHREYGALVGLQYYEYYNRILEAKLSLAPTIDSNEIQKTMETYGVNQPQAKAILSALKTEGFSLIQGPPGTGKTSTICGLVDVFISKRGRPIAAPGSQAPPVRKVLICAPSNAAIDEVAHRIKGTIRASSDQGSGIKVVRLGAEKAINTSAKDISLEYLVEQRMDANPNEDLTSGLSFVYAEINVNKQKKIQLLAELEACRDNPMRAQMIQENLTKLHQERTVLAGKANKLKDAQTSASRGREGNRRSATIAILNEADVICTTLSGSANSAIQLLPFDMVIIDEAANAVELSALIPLQFPVDRCVMVGDPQQLPPTVISQKAASHRYDQSLFVRLQKQKPEAVHLLSIQYRMHPEISILPSKVFYQNRLQDGPDMDTKTVQQWHYHVKYGPYHFFNVNGQEVGGGGLSYSNYTECQVALALYSNLCREFSSFDFDHKVGIVSMYKDQINKLRRTFEQKYGPDISKRIDFNTVDGFQGQEKLVIILSCVRAGPGVTKIGFLSDIRRMNVALTRAKSSLFILGNAATLERSDDTWRVIVEDARSRSCLVDANEQYFAAQSRPFQSTKSVTTKAIASSSTDSTTAQTQSSVEPLSRTKSKKERSTFEIPSASTSSIPASIELTAVGVKKEKKAGLVNNSTSSGSALPTTNPSSSSSITPSQVTGPSTSKKRLAEDPPGASVPAPPVRRKKQKVDIFLPKKRTG